MWILYKGQCGVFCALPGSVDEVLEVGGVHFTDGLLAGTQQ